MRFYHYTRAHTFLGTYDVPNYLAPDGAALASYAVLGLYGSGHFPRWEGKYRAYRVIRSDTGETVGWLTTD